VPDRRVRELRPSSSRTSTPRTGGSWSPAVRIHVGRSSTDLPLTAAAGCSSGLVHELVERHHYLTGATVE
jgi:hypothetical protein